MNPAARRQCDAMDPMTIVATFLALGLLGLVLTAWWLRRLWQRRNDLGPAAKVLGVVVAAASVFGSVGIVASLVKAFGAIGGESLDPSLRARMLGETIAEAMNTAGLSVIIWVPSALVLLVLARRRASDVK